MPFSVRNVEVYNAARKLAAQNPRLPANALAGAPEPTASAGNSGNGTAVKADAGWLVAPAMNVPAALFEVHCHA